MPLDLLSSRLAEKERCFREFAVWPVYEEFDTEQWLSNFVSEEKVVAETLLTNFYYFNERMTNALLRAAIQNYLCREDQCERLSSIGLIDYVTETAFVLCEGEEPHPSDSGNLFARKLRDKLLIPEVNIKRPKEALSQRTNFRRFIFVDDFAGSGNQFLTTWNEKHNIDGRQYSFQDISEQGNQCFAYCCCISTWKARDKISAIRPSVTLSSAHQILDHHSAVNLSSKIWQNTDAELAQSILKNASTRAGYTAENGGKDDWRGFAALGLTLAFNHGIPDASLPIFYSRRENWKPLITRISS